MSRTEFTAAWTGRDAQNGRVTTRSVYLGGPDVFRPDAEEYGRSLVAICSEYGFAGVFPMDQEVPKSLSPAAAARYIYEANLAKIGSCDALVANVDFFRGPEPDSGTCFEIGYAAARGKLVVGYLPATGSFAERIRRRFPQAVGAGLLDASGWHLEEFGQPLNLMLSMSCHVVVGGLREALTALQRVSH